MAEPRENFLFPEMEEDNETVRDKWKKKKESKKEVFGSEKNEKEEKSDTKKAQSGEDAQERLRKIYHPEDYEGEDE